jgi:YHS domain-containing protein
MNALIVIGSLFLFQLHVSTQEIAATNGPDDPRIKHFRLNKNQVAIDGYDPVSYFKSGPVKGSKKISYTHKGIVYHFANAENAAAFQADPNRYEPAWGGWCGHAMAVRGAKVTINPLTYKIVDGRNFLFYNKGKANALVNWEKELAKTPEAQLVKQGDAFWVDVLDK